MKSLAQIGAWMFVAATALAAPVPIVDREEAMRKATKELEGTWELVSRLADGKPAAQPLAMSRLTLKDGKYTIRHRDQVSGEGSFKIDPTMRPRAFDITHAIGSLKGKPLLGIYEIKGDELRLIIAGPGKNRPLKLESREGSGQFLDVFHRVKE